MQPQPQQQVKLLETIHRLKETYMTFPVPQAYRQLIFEDLVITNQKERLWGYRDRDGGGTFDAPKQIHIHDYKLSSEEMDELNYEPVPEQPEDGFLSYALYTPTREGHQYYGWGETTTFAVAHTLYQAIRRDHWGAGVGFNPIITFQEALVFSETDCLPTELMRFENKEEMNEFFSGWKGKKVIMVANVYPEGGSELLRGYYFKKVVPDFQIIFRETEGERLTLKEVDEKLRGMSAVMMEEIPKEESGGFDLVRIKNVYEVSGSQLVEFVDHVRMIASREYHYSIDDPHRV